MPNTAIATTPTDIERIIIIEDEDFGQYYHKYVQSMLNNKNIKVDWYRDINEQTLNEIKYKYTPVGFIIDINIKPVSDRRGFDIIRQLRQHNAYHHVAVYTSYGRREKEALNVGADFFYVKDPSKPKEQVEKIARELISMPPKKQNQRIAVKPLEQTTHPLPLKTIISYKISGKVEAFNNERVLLFLGKQLLNRKNTNNTQDWVIGDFLFEVNCEQTQNHKNKTHFQIDSVANTLQAEVLFENGNIPKKLDLTYNNKTYKWNFKTHDAILNNFTTFSVSPRFPNAKTILRMFTAHRMIDLLVENKEINDDDRKIIKRLGPSMSFELFKILTYKYNANQLTSNTLNDLIKIVEKETEITFKYLYEGQINEIDIDDDIAFTSMTNLKDKNESFPKQFYYSKLKEQMIPREHDKFLYLLYELTEGQACIDIESIGTPKTFF